jgi:alanyl-tRNA synthetase
MASALKVGPAEALPRREALIEVRRQMEREHSDARKKHELGGGSSGAAGEVKEVAGTKFLGKVVEGVSPRDLKSLADDGKKSLGSGVVAFIGLGEDGKASVVVGVTGDLAFKFSAVDLVRKASAALGGQGGGGRPDMAQAGGPDGTKAAEALDRVAEALGA